MEICNARPPIKPFVRRLLVIPDPIDFEKHKRIKRTLAIVEKHKFKKTFLDERALSSNRFYSKKQARELSIGFNMHNSNVKILNKFIKRQSNLTRLSLSFSHKLSDPGWVNVGKFLSQFRNLSKLQIHFERAPQKIKSETLRRLQRSLKKLPRLQSATIKCGLEHLLKFTLHFIQIGFSFNAGLILVSNKSPMEAVVSRARQFIRLKSLTLDPMMNASITDSVLRDLSKAIIKLPDLEKVDFNFQKYTAVSYKGIYSFMNVLTQISNLSVVKFAFYIDDRDFGSLVGHPFWKLRSFKKICLDLMFSSSSSYSTITLTLKNLQEFRHLHCLRANLTDCPSVTDKTIADISATIRKLSKLRKLHLDFNQCQRVSDIGIAAVISSVIGLEKLEKLFLDFSDCCKIPTKNPNINWKAAIFCLNQLTQGNLLFNGCTGLSEELLSEIVGLLSRCQRLSKVSLGLNRCETVRDKTIRVIGKALRKIESLTVLKLELGRDKNKDLIKGVRGTKNFAVDSQNFMEEEEPIPAPVHHIQDRGLVALGKFISKFKLLKEVTINIKDCNNITQEGLQEFCRCFFNLYNLHKFVLNGNLDNPPRELWKIASELDEKLPHRYLFVMQFKRCSSGTERFARGI